MQRTAVLTSGPVGRTLISLTIPLIAGHLAGVAFHLADAYFVGKLGTGPLAAMGFIMPVVMMIFGAALALAMGTSAVVSQAIGRGDSHEVRRLTTHALLLGLIVVAVLSTIGIVTICPLFALLRADESVLALIRTYMIPWYIGMVFLVIPLIGNSAIRATGDTKFPSLIMMTSAGFNIILDPFLIFGLWIFPRWELFGAAFATVIARALSTLASLMVLVLKHRMLELTPLRWSELIDSWKRILFIGLPAAMTSILVPVGTGVVMRFIAGFGREAVAAVAPAMRIESVTMRVMVALAGVMVPFIGQNWGAKEFGRMLTARRQAFAFAILWGLVNLAVLSALGRFLGDRFSDEPRVIDNIALYLWIVPFGYGLRGIFFLSGTIFNAVNRPLSFAAINAIRMLGLYIPMAYVGSLILGYPGVLCGIALSNICIGLISLILTQRLFRRIGVLSPTSSGG